MLMNKNKRVGFGVVDFTEVNGKIGDLPSLETEDKSNLVGAVNEVKSSSSDAIKDMQLKIAELKALGWNVPDDFPIKNELSEDGKILYQKVGRISLKDIEWSADGIGATGIYVYRFPIPSGCKTYDNNVKWNIAVNNHAFVTRPLVTDGVNDLASNEYSVGGRSSGGNYIEFSIKYQDSPSRFRDYMNLNNFYLYYEMSYKAGWYLEGSEVMGKHREKIKLFDLQLSNSKNSSYIDDYVWDYYDEVQFIFVCYPIGGGSAYNMVVGKEVLDKKDGVHFERTNFYVPLAGLYNECYANIDPIRYYDDDNQTQFTLSYSGTTPGGFSDLKVTAYGIKYN